MSGFLAVKAELLLNAASTFLGSKLGDFDGVYDHGVRVMGFGSQGVGEEMVRLVGGFGVPPGDVVSLPPLSLEGDGFLVPVVNGRWYHIHGHDAAH